MSGNPLLLGPLSLDGLEAPQNLAFGGQQRLALHRFPGGGRVIDALGADDAEITLSGSILGGHAATRAQLLDALRVAATPLTLLWDGFAYLVIVSHFAATYRDTGWIDYRIACTVVFDPASAAVTAAASLASSLQQDLSAAAGYGADTSAAQSAIAATGAATPGTAAYATAFAATTGAAGAAQSGMAVAEAPVGAALTPASLATLTASAGQLAQGAAANAYLARAAANLATATG